MAFIYFSPCDDRMGSEKLAGDKRVVADYPVRQRGTTPA